MAHSVATVSLYWWAGPGATLVSALAAGVFALFAIKSNRQLVRLRASLDLVEKTESQEFYQKILFSFSKAARKNFQGMSERQRRNVLFLLNHYEIIAIGIYTHVLDKTFYERWMKTTLVKKWRAAETFIWTMRHPNNMPPREKLFQNFERLAREWEADVP